MTPLRFPASFVPVKSFFLLYFFIWQIFLHSNLNRGSEDRGCRLLRQCDRDFGLYICK